jgi:hypothetical protein
MDDLIEELESQASAISPGIMMSAVRERVEWRAADCIKDLVQRALAAEQIKRDAETIREFYDHNPGPYYPTVQDAMADAILAQIEEGGDAYARD